MNEFTFLVLSACIGLCACVRPLRPYAMIAGGVLCGWLALEFLTTSYRRAEQMPEALTFVGLAISCFGLAWWMLRRGATGRAGAHRSTTGTPSALRTLLCSVLLLLSGPPVYCGAQTLLDWDGDLLSCVFYGFVGYATAFAWMLLVVIVYVLAAGQLASMRHGRVGIVVLAMIVWPLALHFPSLIDGFLPALLLGLVNGLLAAWVLRSAPRRHSNADYVEVNP